MIAVAIQARMSSTRLPNKVLADICGRPMLWHIVQRVNRAKTVDRVVIATSDRPADAPIRAFAQTEGIPCFAGSEMDLVDRLLGTARAFDADPLIRITGDCPLSDPEVVDQVVEAFLSDPSGVDCACNTHPPTYPDGLDVEVYPRRTLERLWREIDDQFWREWFPVYLAAHGQDFQIRNVAHEPDLSHLRWTVDYEEDLVFVREIFGRVGTDGQFGMRDVLGLLESSSQLTAINSGHNRDEGFEREVATKARSGPKGGAR